MMAPFGVFFFGFDSGKGFAGLGSFRDVSSVPFAIIKW